MTCTSTISQKANESSSSELSPWLCVGDVIQDQQIAPRTKAQSEVPFNMWHRPSEKKNLPNPTKTVTLVDFYLTNTEHSKSKIPTQCRKKHWQHVCWKMLQQRSQQKPSKLPTNLPSELSFLLWDCVSIRKCHKLESAEQMSFNSEIFASLETAGSWVRATRGSSMQIVRQ